MPPKKNEEDVNEEGSELDLAMVRKSQLDVEIKLLQDRYDRSDLKCNELAQTNKKLEFDLLTQKEDQVDIFTYLNTELSKRVEQVARLEAQIQELGAAQKKWEAETKAEFEEIKRTQDLTVEELHNKINEYKAELDDLHEFTKHKNDLEQKLRAVEDELQQEHDRHLISLTDLERKHTQDREKIKREYHDRLESDKNDLIKMTNNQLEFTTRRTIMENEMMTAELGYQNKQTEKLVKVNEELDRQNLEMKRDMELSRQAEAELVRKNYQFQKTIKMMQMKLKAQEMDNQDAKTLEEANNRLVGDVSDKQASVLEEKLHALRHKYVMIDKECDSLRKQLDEARAETKRMQMLKDEARDFLLACLDDARKQFTVQTGESKDWTSDQAIPWSLQGLSMAGREALLEYLLARLGGTNFAGARGSGTGGRNSRLGRQGQNAVNTPSDGHSNGPVFPPIHSGRSSPMNSPTLDNFPERGEAPGLFGTWGKAAQIRHKVR